MVASPTVFELEADGFTEAECRCSDCGRTDRLPFSQIRAGAHSSDVWAMTLPAIAGSLRCGCCGGSALALAPKSCAG